MAHGGGAFKSPSLLRRARVPIWDERWIKVGRLGVPRRLEFLTRGPRAWTKGRWSCSGVGSVDPISSQIEPSESWCWI